MLNYVVMFISYSGGSCLGAYNVSDSGSIEEERVAQRDRIQINLTKLLIIIDRLNLFLKNFKIYKCHRVRLFNIHSLIPIPYSITVKVAKSVKENK